LQSGTSSDSPNRPGRIPGGAWTGALDLPLGTQNLLRPADRETDWHADGRFARGLIERDAGERIALTDRSRAALRMLLPDL